VVGTSLILLVGFVSDIEPAGGVEYYIADIEQVLETPEMVVPIYLSVLEGIGWEGVSRKKTEEAGSYYNGGGPCLRESVPRLL
jgi:hypothetical protein